MNRPSLPMVFSVFAIWLLLVDRIDAGQVLLAAVLAVVLPLIGQRLRPEHARMHRPLVAARLALVVLWDIVVANIHVAGLILGPESRLRSGFVWVPLDIVNPYGISALAGIITMTPGTVSVRLSTDRRYLLLHVLDFDDEAAVVDAIKRRYERPLLEVFP